jgi:hypothetical protein
MIRLRSWYSSMVAKNPSKIVMQMRSPRAPPRGRRGRDISKIREFEIQGWPANHYRWQLRRHCVILCIGDERNRPKGIVVLHSIVDGPQSSVIGGMYSKDQLGGATITTASRGISRGLRVWKRTLRKGVVSRTERTVRKPTKRNGG